MTKLIFQIMCVTVVQWSSSCLHVQINRVRLPPTLFPVSLYLPFLSVWLSPEYYFGKGTSKALDLHTGQAYDQIKTISSQDMSLLRNSRIFFQCQLTIMTSNTQYTANCTNLHPTPTSDPLVKVKLAFCTYYYYNYYYYLLLSILLP